MFRIIFKFHDFVRIKIVGMEIYRWDSFVLDICVVSGIVDCVAAGFVYVWNL